MGMSSDTAGLSRLDRMIGLAFGALALGLLGWAGVSIQQQGNDIVRLQVQVEQLTVQVRNLEQTIYRRTPDYEQWERERQEERRRQQEERRRQQEWWRSQQREQENDPAPSQN